ncbi:MAG: DMT family transporter [Deltaproteobacteria bacterium]|nr:DMT family transporter [Deltaproteobacteria bacterium]
MDPGIFSSGEFFSVACALVWAIATILFRKGGEHVPPVALNLFKDAVGLVLFLVTLPIIGVRLLDPSHPPSDWAILLASGALGIGIADSLFFAALNRLGAGRLSIVASLYSPAVVVFAFLYLGEPLGLAIVSGAALMMGAVVVGTWEPARTAARADRKMLAEGVALGLVSVTFMAAGIVLAKPVLNTADPWWAATVRLIGGTALLCLQALTRQNRGSVRACFTPNASWRFTVPAAFIGAYVAMIMWVVGFKYTSAGIAGVLNQTNVIFALILGALFLGEPVTLRKVLAVVLAFAGAAAAMWK